MTHEHTPPVYMKTSLPVRATMTIEWRDDTTRYVVLKDEVGDVVASEYGVPEGYTHKQVTVTIVWNSVLCTPLDGSGSYVSSAIQPRVGINHVPIARRK